MYNKQTFLFGIQMLNKPFSEINSSELIIQIQSNSSEQKKLALIELFSRTDALDIKIQKKLLEDDLHSLNEPSLHLFLSNKLSADDSTEFKINCYQLLKNLLSSDPEKDQQMRQIIKIPTNNIGMYYILDILSQHKLSHHYNDIYSALIKTASQEEIDKLVDGLMKQMDYLILDDDEKYKPYTPNADGMIPLFGIFNRHWDYTSRALIKIVPKIATPKLKEVIFWAMNNQTKNSQELIRYMKNLIISIIENSSDMNSIEEILTWIKANIHDQKTKRNQEVAITNLEILLEMSQLTTEHLDELWTDKLASFQHSEHDVADVNASLFSLIKPHLSSQKIIETTEILIQQPPATNKTIILLLACIKLSSYNWHELKPHFLNLLTPLSIQMNTMEEYDLTGYIYDLYEAGIKLIAELLGGTEDSSNIMDELFNEMLKRGDLYTFNMLFEEFVLLSPQLKETQLNQIYQLVSDFENNSACSKTQYPNQHDELELINQLTALNCTRLEQIILRDRTIHVNELFATILLDNIDTSEPMTPPFEINEFRLNRLIEVLEHKNTAQAFFICAELLIGRIENSIEESSNPDEYREKRLHDAISFYENAAQDKMLTSAISFLLWELKTVGSEFTSIKNRLAQLDVTPEHNASSWANFGEKNSVQMHLNKHTLFNTHQTNPKRELIENINFDTPKK